MEQIFNRMIMHHSDEEDEALSLCDLPLYGEPDDFLKEDQISSSSSSDGQLVDHFEFFTEEWISTASYNQTDNILFCGKLIPYKQNVVDNSLKLKSNKQRKRRKYGALKWNLKAKTSKSKGQKGKCINKNASTTLTYSSSSNSFPSSKQCMNRHGNRGDKNDILGQRITILKSPTTKSKWFLFFFGMARIPTEMQMREVRKRQNKKSRSLRSNGGGKKSGKSKRKGWWWKLIRALGCSGYHCANAVIKATYCYAPLVRT